MKDAVFFLMDIVSYGILGYFLAKLLQKTLPERFTFYKYDLTGQMVCLQFLLVRLFLSYSKAVQRLVYGEDMVMTDSKMSILPVAVSMGITLVFCMVLYTGSKMELLSLVINFYALLELVRFVLYSFSVWIINRIFAFYEKKFINEMEMNLQKFDYLTTATEIIWNFIMTAWIILLLYLCLKQYKKYLLPEAYPLRRSKAALLLVPGVIGLVLGIMLRCMMFYYREKEFHTIVEEYPEMNLLIPCMSLLCIISILMSVKMLFQVEKEHEKRRRAEVYQNRVTELEAHIRDMEGLYDGIRGMKHDMKNYIADIKALVFQMADGDEKNKRELKKYIDSIQCTMDSLDFKYQTGNPVTDVILGRYVKLAEQKQIFFTSEFVFPKGLNIDAFDISILLNNALENAVEACEKIEQKKRKIEIDSYQRGNMFFLKIKNSFDGRIKKNKSNDMESLKEEGHHGFGLKNMKSCADKYYGKIEVRAEEDMFILTVMLQGEKRCFLVT